MEKLLEDMVQSGVTPSANCFVQVICAYSECAMPEKAESWFQKLEKTQFAPQIRAFVEMIKVGPYDFPLVTSD